MVCFFSSYRDVSETFVLITLVFSSGLVHTIRICSITGYFIFKIYPRSQIIMVFKDPM